uniref:Uncharacterized protein n=1 Tax=Anguilla anguilla TaxID=7936 RepID=A0A0E9R6C4_ANGAN
MTSYPDDGYFFHQPTAYYASEFLASLLPTAD